MRKGDRIIAFVCGCCMLTGLVGCGKDEKPVVEGTGFYTQDTIVWETEESVGLEFAYSSDGTYYTLKDLDDCKDTKLVIPEKIGETPVKAIVYNAFANCEQLVEVVIPDTITSIAFMAFSNCPNLERVKIGSGVKKIEGATFYNCPKLQTVVFSEGLERIEAEAFKYCTQLNNVVIPDSVQAIDQRAFCGCAGLERLLLPTYIETVADFAFEGCTKLNSVYYRGQKTDWQAISFGLGNEPLQSKTRYYYTAEKPEKEGNYWREVDGEIVLW